MPISTETSKARLLGNGATTVFPFSFRVIDADHLVVVIADAEDNQTTLLLDTDYTVTLNTNDGTVNYPISGSPLPTGWSITIKREVPLIQETDFGNQGGFFPENHTDTADYAMQAIQQLAEELDRAPKVSLTSGLTGDELVETVTDAAASAAADAATAVAAKDAALVAQGVCEDAQAAVEEAVSNIVASTFEATAGAGATYVDVTGFVLAQSLDNIELYIDGVKQAKSTLTRTSDTRLTFGGALVGGEKIEVRSAAFDAAAVNEAIAAAASAASAASDAQDAADEATAAAAGFTAASQAEAEAGTENTHYMTALRTAQAKKTIAAPGSDHTASGIKIDLTAHENVAFGDICYINSDGEAQIADADAIATSSAIVMAIATISANATGEFMLQGIARDDTWNWTVGGLIYLTVTGTSGNTLSQTAPSGTDDVIQIIGVATHADRMFFNPQLIQVEHT